MTSLEIAQIKKRLLDAKEQERADFERALEAKYAEKLKTVDSFAELHAELEGPPPDESPVSAGESESARSLEDRIEEHFKGQINWTVPDVQKTLEIPEQQRGTVWNAVKRLVDAAKVQVLKPGAGRRPAKYGWVNENQDVVTNHLN